MKPMGTETRPYTMEDLDGNRTSLLTGAAATILAATLEIGAEPGYLAAMGADAFRADAKVAAMIALQIHRDIVLEVVNGMNDVYERQHAQAVKMAGSVAPGGEA
jgi:hypothetical protein